MIGKLRAVRIGTVLAGGILVLALLAGGPSPARAWFAASPNTDSGTDRAVAKKKPVILPGLRQIGAAGEIPGEDYTQPVRGFGHHVTLREALDGLLGPGWTVLSRGVAPGTRIDWTGGTTLPQTLSRIARVYGLGIRVDWRSRTIALSRTREGRHRSPLFQKTEPSRAPHEEGPKGIGTKEAGK